MKNISTLIFIGLISSCSFIPVQKSVLHQSKLSSNRLIPDTSIALLDWNIHKESSVEWNADFYSLLEKTKPNLVLFQEAKLNDSLNSFLQNSDVKVWAHAANLMDQSDSFYSGVLTASKYQSISDEAYITEGTEPFSHTPKSFLLSKYKLSFSKKILLVVNVHGINFKWGIDEYKEQFNRIFSKIKNHVGPVILAGDFNCWNQDREDYLNQKTKEILLQKVDFQEKAKEIESFRGYALDRIYYSNDLEVILNSPQVFSEIESSDHKAIFAKFKLKKMQ